MTLNLSGSTGVSGVDGSAATPALQGNDTNTGISFGTDVIIVSAGGTERVRIDSSGRLLVGTTSTSAVCRALFQGHSSDTSSGTFVYLTRGDSSPADGSGLGSINFADSSHTTSASIATNRDGGTWSGSSKPTRLVFSTTADGASSPTERLRIQADGRLILFNTDLLYPNTDNAVGLGATNHRFSAVWAANGTIQTSDGREKTDVTNATLGIEFIQSLRPVSYKWIEGGKRDTGERDEDNNCIYESVPGTRTHWGFIAQEVKQAVDAAGVDFGGWVLTDKDDPDSQQALRYDQFIAPLTKALQEALAEIDALKAKVAALEAAPSA